ncbi:MAG: glycosyltransferase family 4 protein [Geobacteraceae bacterium]
MKILLVNNDKGWGGGQQHLLVLANELQRLGCFSHFLCRENSPSAHKYASLGFPVWPLWGAGAGFFRSVRATASLLRQEHFDVVVVAREHDLFRTVLARKLAYPVRKQGKVVMSFHTATRKRHFFLGSVDSVVCVSSYIHDKLRASNKKIAAPVTVIGNGIPVQDEPGNDKFSLQRKRRYFSAVGFPLIGMVGAFFKNQIELVESIPLLKQDFPGIKVALVGDDSDSGLTAPLRERARQLGVSDSVIFTGAVPHERIADVYYDLDLSVSTFRNEGFGLVHLESLAAGTPVVTYDEGGQVDILQGGKGGVLVAGGIAEFAATVIALLKDHKLRFTLGRNGYELVKTRFSVETMGRNYADLFKSLVAGRFSFERLP